jgi:hypothetical protein
MSISRHSDDVMLIVAVMVISSPGILPGDLTDKDFEAAA